MARTSTEKARRKFKFERTVGRMVMNPTVAALGKLGIHVPLTVELETVGRKSGEPRRVPLNGRAGQRRAVGHLAARPTGRLGLQRHRQPTGARPDQGSMAQRDRNLRAQ